MNRFTGILIAAAAIVGTSYVGYVGAAERTESRTTQYNCGNGVEVVQLYIIRTPLDEFQVQIQGQSWAQRFRHMSPFFVDKDPALSGSKPGIDITVRSRELGEKLDVAYTGKDMFTCDYVDQFNLVSYGK